MVSSSRLKIFGYAVAQFGTPWVIESPIIRMSPVAMGYSARYSSFKVRKLFEKPSEHSGSGIATCERKFSVLGSYAIISAAEKPTNKLATTNMTNVVRYFCNWKRLKQIVSSESPAASRVRDQATTIYGESTIWRLLIARTVIRHNAPRTADFPDRDAFLWNQRNAG